MFSTDSFFVSGLFEYNNMQYDAERINDTAGEPSLEEMVEKAIKILCKNEQGFFLFVEGRSTYYPDLVLNA